MEETNLTIRISAIEDKMAIRETFDTFSILADERDLQTQSLLFTENAIVESYFNGQLALTFNGRKEISEGFADFVKNFETLYHINGQQTVKLNGDKATKKWLISKRKSFFTLHEKVALGQPLM